jgi:UDP-2,3-diacylglucosamine pyrophosphatase LpxH
MTQSILFFSDLHRGKSNSLATPGGKDWTPLALDKLENDILAHDLVFNMGDLIHNVKESNNDLFTLQKTTIEWYINLAAKNPQKNFFYLYGNHEGDVDTKLIKLIEAAAETLPNFKISPYGCLIGDSLVTHGDLILRLCNPNERAKKTNIATAAPVSKPEIFHDLLLDRLMHAYDGGHLDFPVYDYNQKCYRTLNLQDIASLKHVFSGHTHETRYSSVELPLFTYHNTGSFCNEVDKPIGSPQDLKYLTAKLVDGKISDVRPAVDSSLQSWTDLAKRNMAKSGLNPF